jgi:DNA replication licensing factor MCM7
VSVAKAGIVATLNARAAVLAAANPLYGRYNRKKSLSENVNLPNSLLSRFDLMFLILDIADVDKDMALARHVTFVHQNEGLESQKKDNDDDSDDEDMQDENNEEEDSKKTLPPEIVREYISRARKYQPVVQPDVAPYIVEAYVGLRMQGTPGVNNNRNRRQTNAQNGDQTAMTARQLLSILRLSQALARLRFSDYVAREDVDEAIRLTHMSKASLEDNDGDSNDARKTDITSRIWAILKDYATASRAKRVEVKLCEAMVLRKGFTSQQLQTCLEEYQNLDVIMLNSTGTHIDFLQ